MNIWELLGIEPTEDISKIKSAYARQAKQCHPEEHPEEFKALQNAYKTALQFAKSRKAGVPLPYAPPVRMAEPENDVEAKRWEPEDDRRKRQEVPEAGRQEPPETGQHVSEDGREFDFSDVDAYGDRGQFLGQFLLLAKNPYLHNNLEAWDYFLHQDVYAGLFSNTDFRRELVQAICGLKGWRRKTVLYFEKFLSEYQTKENRPKDGQWETGLRAFRMKKIPRLRLPAFCMDRFWRKEGRNFHRQLCRKISKESGREIDLDVKTDLIRYMKLYLSYAETAGPHIDRLYRGWRFEQALILGVAAFVCYFVIATEAGYLQYRRENAAQMEYLTELYGPDFFPETVEEQRVLQSEYKMYWRYADEAIDEVLERYREW